MAGLGVAREEVVEELADRRRPLDGRAGRRFDAGVRGEQGDQLLEVVLGAARRVREDEVAIQWLRVLWCAEVLHALADPVRLSVVRQLSDGRSHACGAIDTPLAASAMTRHFRILRESGVVRAEPCGTSKLLTLRREDLDARLPGLLDSVLRAPAE